MRTTVEKITGARTELYIGGKWVTPASGRYLDSYDPATGKVWYQAADGGEEDIAAAVQAAQAALANPAWRRITQTERGAMMRRLAALLAEHADEIGRLETRDNGKLLKEMKAQAAVLPDSYYYFAGMTDKIQGDFRSTNAMCSTSRRRSRSVLSALSSPGIRLCSSSRAHSHRAWPSAIPSL